MHAWTKKWTQYINLTLNEGDDDGEGARGGRPIAKALGGRANSNQ